MANDTPPDDDAGTFCVVPFIEANVMPTGAVRACCAFYPSIAQGGRPMSVYEHSVDEIWNSDNMRDVRRSLIEQKKVAQCSYCYTQERSSPPSLRMELNRGFAGGYGNPHGETLENIKAKAIANDYRVPEGPAWIDLELGNLCNLRCRMCSSTWSSRIAADATHSRWSTKDIDAAVRWRGREMVVAPRRALGIEYEGFSALDQTSEVPLAWIRGSATIRMKRAGAELSSVQVKLQCRDTHPVAVELFANDASVYRGALGDGRLDQTVDLPPSVNSSDTLALRLETSGSVGVAEIVLLRSERGKSTVALSRLTSDRQWFQDEDFLLGELLGKVGSLTKLTMVGGEPLLIKEVHAMMRFLISKGVAENVMLSLVTNGTTANDEVCDLAAQFRSVLIGVSLDGVGGVNDYIRDGSSWAEIEPNIRRLQSIPNSNVYVNMTVQAYNMMHVPAVAEFIEKLGLGFRYHYLIGPPHLSCLVLPVEARRLAASRIRAFASRGAAEGINPVRAEVSGPLLDLAKILESDDTPPDKNLLNEFMVFTNDLDASRNQSFATVNPELLGLIEASGITWSGATRFATGKGEDDRELEDAGELVLGARECTHNG